MFQESLYPARHKSHVHEFTAGNINKILVLDRTNGLSQRLPSQRSLQCW